ncbi:MAG: DUF2460 domain-containing protein [bacterium]
MSNDLYPRMPQAEMVQVDGYSTDVWETEPGFNWKYQVRSFPVRAFKLKYDPLNDTEFQALRNFWLRHRGNLESFLVEDYTDRTHTGVFAYADGEATTYWLPFDVAAAVTISVDGVVDPAAAVNLTTGLVTFTTAPLIGSELSYAATTPRYRVRFAASDLPATRHKFIAWGAEVTLVQARGI